MDLVKSVKELLDLDGPGQLIDMKFRFVAEGRRDELVSKIVSVQTTDDGLPRIEVAARRFSGFTIRCLLIDQKDHAILLTTVPDPAYSHIPGDFWIAPE